MEKINEYEIDGLIQTMKETGIKGLMKYTDVLVLNHMMERGWIPPIEKRDKPVVFPFCSALKTVAPLFLEISCSRNTDHGSP